MGRKAAAKKAARARAKREGTRPATSTWTLPSTATARCFPARAAAVPAAVPDGWLVQPQPQPQPQPQLEPDGRNLRPAIWRQLLRHEGPALSGPWGEYSFEQLRGLMSCLAACLRPVPSATGCSMRVGLLCDEGPVIPLLELTVAALLPRGSCFVPLDPTMPSERLHFLMCDAGVSTVVTTPGYYDAVLAPLLLAPRGIQCDRVVVLDCAEGECWLDRARSKQLDGEGGQECKQPERERLNQHAVRSLADRSGCKAEVASKAPDVGGCSPSADPATRGGAVDPLYLIYTSGTTGTPKGVLGETVALFTYLGRSDCMRRVPGDRVLLCGAVTWDPSVSDVFGTLVGTIDEGEGGGIGPRSGGGATLVLERRARLVTRLDLCVEDWEVTHVLATPALWRMVFAARSAPADTSITQAEHDPTVGCDDNRLLSLRSLQLGGEAWSASEIFQPRNLQVLQNIYGTTENVVYQAAGPNLAAGQNVTETALRGLHSGIIFRVLLDDASTASSRPSSPETDASSTATGELLIGGTQVLSYHVPKASRSASGDHRFSLGGHPQSEAGEEVARLNRTKFFTDSDGVRWFRTGDRVDAQVTPRQQETQDTKRCDATDSSDGDHLSKLGVSRLVSAFCIVGRVDRQVKINGYRVELDEIEAVLEQAPVLAMQPGSAVVCHYLAKEKRLLAFVDRPGTACTTHRHDRDTAEEASVLSEKKVCFDDLSVVLRAFCESRMPKWQVPHRFVGVHVPLTTSGKVDRVAVLAAWRHEQSKHYDDATSATRLQLSGSTELRTPFERLLGNIWSDLFPEAVASEGISARSHFFEMGGTSVLAVQMVAKVATSAGSVHVVMVDDAQARHRRLCALINTPRLREYAKFLEAEAARRATLDMTGLGAEGVAANAGAQQATPQQQFRKKKGRRKRRDLNTGLQRHTIKMIDRYINQVDQQSAPTAAVQAEAKAAVGTTEVETTEAEVLRLARACGDVHAVETLEIAMAAADGALIGGTACG